MKKTTQIIVMAVLCLNFCYGQQKKACPDLNQNNIYQLKDCQYGITGFKSGFKPGYILSDNRFNKGQTIMVRNCTLIELFSIAMGTGVSAGKPGRICTDQVTIDVRDPKPLHKLYCYKLVVPAWQVDNFFVLMQQNLKLEFPQYVVTMERRELTDFMVIRDKDEEL